MACADEPATAQAPAPPPAPAGASTGAARDGFGARLRQLRSDRGLTQVELAGETISPGLVSLLESGRREPSIRTLDYLAQRLGCQPSDLLVTQGSELGAAGPLAVLRAEVALRSGAPGEALAAFTAVARARHPVPGIAPDRPLLGRAQALEALGRVSDAIEALEQLRDAGAGDRACWFPVATSLGCCYLRVGRYRTGNVLLRELNEEMEALDWAGTSDHARVVAALIELALQRGAGVRPSTWPPGTSTRACPRPAPPGPPPSTGSACGPSGRAGSTRPRCSPSGPRRRGPTRSTCARAPGSSWSRPRC